MRNCETDNQNLVTFKVLSVVFQKNYVSNNLQNKKKISIRNNQVKVASFGQKK